MNRSGRVPLWVVVVVIAILVGAALAFNNIYRFRRSHGAGTGSAELPRAVAAGDVSLPPGYEIDAVATGLTFPTAVALDDAGRLHVIEAGYVYGEKWTTPRLLRVEPEGRLVEVARGTKPPWTGVSFSNGAFLIAEGGARDGGRIIRVTPDGTTTVLVDSLPSMGDHHVNRAVAGPDGSIYFSIGTATNSGVVGEDNWEFGWLKRHPTFHDIPCRDITLAGKNYETRDVRAADSAGRATTGAFVPFGTPTTPGQVIRGSVPCSGSVLRVASNGGPPDLVAWGFRNPYGLSFAPDGTLYITENGFDIRGSRGIFGGADHLYRIETGKWYGWPDFAGGIPVAQERFKPEGKPQPSALLAALPNPPPQPVARLAVHSSSNGFDFSTNQAFGHVGEAFIAQFGDMTPKTGKVWAPVGARVVRVDLKTGDVRDFIINKGKTHGPASEIGSKGIERPVDARFGPGGSELYITDFGIMTVSDKGPAAREKTGVIWRVRRTSAVRPR
ncbi:MAG: PQQ-dependent sugar dehydrogenase [Gemmatimonadaceae bacterium]